MKDFLKRIDETEIQEMKSCNATPIKSTVFVFLFIKTLILILIFVFIATVSKQDLEKDVKNVVDKLIEELEENKDKEDEKKEEDDEEQKVERSLMIDLAKLTIEDEENDDEEKKNDEKAQGNTTPRKEQSQVIAPPSPMTVLRKSGSYIKVCAAIRSSLSPQFGAHAQWSSAVTSPLSTASLSDSVNVTPQQALNVSMTSADTPQQQLNASMISASTTPEHVEKHVTIESSAASTPTADNANSIMRRTRHRSRSVSGPVTLPSKAAKPSSSMSQPRPTKPVDKHKSLRMSLPRHLSISNNNENTHQSRASPRTGRTSLRHSSTHQRSPYRTLSPRRSGSSDRPLRRASHYDSPSKQQSPRSPRSRRASQRHSICLSSPNDSVSKPNSRSSSLRRSTSRRSSVSEKVIFFSHFHL